MGALKIISETGMFHSACEVTIGGAVDWYGFQPASARNPVSAGKVDRSNRSAYINHFAIFTVSDGVLRYAIDKAAADYASKNYILGVVDCVSFTADVARNCGMGVPLVNLSPYGFLQTLMFHNTYTSSG